MPVFSKEISARNIAGGGGGLFIHYTHATYQIMARLCTVRFLSLSAQWRHVASFPAPSAQACPKKMWFAPRRLQKKEERA